MDTTQQNLLLPEEEGIDIKKYIFLIFGHWWWFGISIFVSLTIAYLVNRYSQEIYSSNCSIIIGEEKAGSGSIENVLDELSKVRTNKRKAVVENEITILKSYKMARMALEGLDFNVNYISVGRRGIAESQLYNQCPFVAEWDTSKANMIGYPVFVTILSSSQYRLTIDDKFQINRVMNFGEKFEHGPFHFTLRLKDPINYKFAELSVKKYIFKLNNINNLANQYRQALNVEVNDEKGAILTLGMQGFVPEQLSDYLNKLSEVYLRSNLDEKNRTSENTIWFIDEQLTGIVDSLEITGLKLQQFRSANKVINLSTEGNFLFQQVQDLQKEKGFLDMQANYYKYLLDYMDKKNEYNDIVAPAVVGIQDNLLNTMVGELNRLLVQKRQMSYSVNENSPQVVLINNQIDNAKNSLKENMKSLIESNKLSIDNVDGRIAKIDREVQKLPGTEKQMIDIQRKFKINDQIYTFLLQKRAEAGITKASNTSDHKILDIARPENAGMVKPKVSMNYMMGLFAGAGIPLVLLLLLEFFNNKITDRKYLENTLHVPIIGNIGHNDIQSEMPVYSNPKSSMAESFRAIRSNLQYILKEPKSKVIAVSSAVSGEGKTYCSVNLASILALAGKKTLIVSLDLRRPKVHRIFNISNEEGISNFLIGKSKYEDIIKETNVNNLFMVTAGPIPPNPAELLGVEQMQRFIRDARKDFDYIIIDTPPVGIVTDALALKDHIDSFVFVIRHNYSDKHVVELINDLQERKIFANICVVVNDIQLSGYYGYSYKYGYQYGYGYSSHYNQYEDYVEKDARGNIFKEIRRVFGMKG
jgi:tyrosine-protein kinase Etk/Wzc